MKKIFLGAAALVLFSFSLSIVQMSCQQNALATPQAQSVNAPVNLGIILVALNDSTLVTMKYDGTDMKQIPIIMPSGKSMQGYTAKLSPDGTKVFFMGYEKNNGSSKTLYSANMDGSSIQPIFSSAIGYLLQPY